MTIIEKLTQSQKLAMSIKPQIGGFPVLAEVPRQAGVIGYDADFMNRKVTYVGVNGESYLEEYPPVQI